MFRHFSHSAQSWKTWGIAGGPGACLCSADLHRWFVPDGSRCNGSFVAEDPEQNSSYRDHYLVRFELQLHSMSLFKQIMLSQDEHSAPPIAWSSLCRMCHWTCPLLRFEFRSNFMPQHDTTAPAGTSIPSYPIPFFDILWWLVIIGWLKFFQLVMTCHDITHVIQLIPTDSNWFQLIPTGGGPRCSLLEAQHVPMCPDVSHGSADRGSNGSRSAQPMSWTPFQALCWIEWRRWRPNSLKII